MRKVGSNAIPTNQLYGRLERSPQAVLGYGFPLEVVDYVGPIRWFAMRDAVVMAPYGRYCTVTSNLLASNSLQVQLGVCPTYMRVRKLHITTP